MLLFWLETVEKVHPGGSPVASPVRLLSEQVDETAIVSLKSSEMHNLATWPVGGKLDTFISHPLSVTYVNPSSSSFGSLSPTIKISPLIDAWVTSSEAVASLFITETK